MKLEEIQIMYYFLKKKLIFGSRERKKETANMHTQILKLETEIKRIIPESSWELKMSHEKMKWI